MGGQGIAGCTDKQDWGGLSILELIDKEGLYLLNREDVCEGIVTRVDPRNGTKSTLDLAICNEFMVENINKMIIDEKEEFKPSRYHGNKVTKTDHNTILLEIEAHKVKSMTSKTYFNTKCEIGQNRFQEEIQNIDFSGLFEDTQKKLM